MEIIAHEPQEEPEYAYPAAEARLAQDRWALAIERIAPKRLFADSNQQAR